MTQSSDSVQNPGDSVAEERDRTTNSNSAQDSLGYQSSADRPWLDHYAEGVKWDVPTDTFKNVIELLEDTFERFGEAPALENLGCVMTYGELKQEARKFAAFLQARGLGVGDTLAIQVPNLLQYPVVLFGAILAGLRTVNLNPLYTTAEMLKPLKDSGAKGIVILANFAHKLEKALPETALELVVVTEVADALPFPKRTLINFLAKRLKKMVPAYHLPRAVSYREALQLGQTRTYKKPDIAPTDIVFLQYTGGTTGVPKAAELTHSNIVANVLQVKAAFITLEPGKEVLIAALPFYHIFGLTVNCLFMMHMGSKLVLITNPRDMPAFIKTLTGTRFTMFTGLNTLFNALMNQPGFERIDFSASKLFVAGGMALQTAVGERWQKLTGRPILEGYGMSETSPVLSCNLPGRNIPGTIGQPFPRTELGIFDDEGKPVPLGERGEICARGPQVMQRYFNQPEETAAVFFADGWFRTGDIGTMDENGYVRIVDRKKDMILVSGFNVYPNEVEEVIVRHPGVLECAVIGVPDPQSTERVKACVVRKNDSVTEEEIIAHCRESLTSYKVPKVVQFYTELPKSQVGKIIRRELR